MGKLLAATKKAISNHWQQQPRDKEGRWRQGTEYIPLAKRPHIQEMQRTPIRGMSRGNSPTPVDHAKHQAHIEAQKHFDNAADILKRKQSQLELLKTRVNTAADAVKYKRLKNIEIPQAHSALTDAESKLKKAHAALHGDFKSGVAMSKKDLESPLSENELEIAKKDLKLAGDPNLARWLPKGHSQREAYDRDRDALKKAKQVAPDLTSHEFKAINNYTGHGYVAMNGAFRGLQLDPSSENAQSQRVHAKVLHQALSKAPVFKGEVRRDTRIPTSELSNYHVGKSVEFHGVTSTSKDLTGRETANYGSQSKTDILAGKTNNESSKASKYEDLAKAHGIRVLPQDASSQVEYRITTKSGRDISGISKAAKESEIALPHGFKGKITKIEDAGNGVKRVHIHED